MITLAHIVGAIIQIENRKSLRPNLVDPEPLVVGTEVLQGLFKVWEFGGDPCLQSFKASRNVSSR